MNFPRVADKQIHFVENKERKASPIKIGKIFRNDCESITVVTTENAAINPTVNLHSASNNSSVKQVGFHSRTWGEIDVFQWLCGKFMRHLY